MWQYELFIQIIIIIIKKMKKKKSNKRKGRETGVVRMERERKIFFLFFLSSLLSKIYGNRTRGFRRSRRQSRSTQREICVGTKILEFHQTPRGREFSYLCYF